MTVRQLADLLSAKIISSADLDRQVKGGYAGDLLSYVMGKAPADCAWLTIMTNVNVIAVAVLADVSVVVLCDGCVADELLVARAKSQGVNVLSTEEGIFDVAVKVGNAC